MSLGINVKNNSPDPELQKEGNVMSVIIKRGTHIPTFNTQTYHTVYDNQISTSIDVYEGEKKYVKYNHLLKKSNISGLKERPKGKTKILVTFDIDINGILNVKAKEESEDNKGKTLELTIKNDEISLTKEQIENLKIKNQALFEKMKDNELSSKIDYTNLKDTLKKYQDAYNKCKNNPKPKKKDDDDEDEEEDPRITYITNFNETLENFIDNFDKNFDNETVLEKLYLYVKELFLSYVETLKLDIEKGDKNRITSKIKEYINIFIDKSSGYLSSLLEVLKDITKGKKKNKILFYELVISIMEELNKYGKEYISSNKPFCKYHSLIYFEQAKNYYEKYLSNIDENLLKGQSLNSLKKQKDMYTDYIRDINSGAVVLFEESFKGGFLINEEIVSTGRGITNDLRRLALGNIENRVERCKIVLSNYEKVLASIQTENRMSKKEAICIANIIKLNSILGQIKSKCNILLPLARRVELIIEHENIDKNEEWYKEFIKLNEILKKNQRPDDDYQTLLKQMKETHGPIFDEIDDKFIKGGKEGFIKYILDKHPYQDYQKDKNNGRNFNNYNTELIKYLHEKYQPETPSVKNEQNLLKYCIIHEICKKLSNLLTTF